MRVDIPHIRALESAVSYDFDSMLRGMFTGLNKSYIVRGFKIKIPTASISANALQVQVADSAVLHSNAAESGTLLTVDAGEADQTLSSDNTKVFGAFQANAINYLSLDYRRFTDTSTVDQTAGWSASQKLEYQRAAPIGSVLDYRFVISTNGFGTNLPLYIVKTNISGAVEYITKAGDGLFRLGSGGANPDATHSFEWGNYTNNQAGANARREWMNTDSNLPNSMSVKPGDDALAFDFGDWSITSFKQWMDAVMSRFKELTESDLWYVSTRLSLKDVSIFNLWHDSIGSVLTGAGDINYNLILESGSNLTGRFKSLVTDQSISRGQLYVEGVTSNTQASVSSYQEGQLLVYGMTKSGFNYDEALRMRRLYRPSDFFKTTDFNNAGFRVAALQRQTILAGATIVGTAFSYENQLGDELAGSIVTITAAGHGLTAGKFVRLSGFSLGLENLEGIHRVKEVLSSSQFTVVSDKQLVGTATGGGTITLDAQDLIPFHPKFTITSIESGGGNLLEMTIPEHNFVAPQSVAASGTNGTNQLTFSGTPTLKIGMKVSGAGIPADTEIVRVNGLIVQLSKNLTAGVASARTITDRVLATGMISTSFAAGALDKLYDVAGVTSTGEVIVDIGTPFIDATTAQTSAQAEPLAYETLLTINKAQQDVYDLVNTRAVSFFGQSLRFFVGDQDLPPIGDIQGLYTLDVVIATSTVLNPVKVQSITNDGAGNLTVVTTVPHGYASTIANTNVTIFGDATLSEFIRSYVDITIVPIDSTTFEIQDTGIINSNSYTNPGSDKTFARFADNPYAGPIQWTSDVVIKSIMGDLSFRIPQTATIDTTDADVSLNANDYNVNGQTGTAYLEDGEVLYAILERNESVSNGATYSIVNSTITTPSILTDKNGDPLEAGDWLKMSDEPETRWLKIQSINAFTAVLVNDKGQTASLAVRPNRTGKLVYCKGTYNTLKVKKHALMDLTSDVYWLAVRRDNGNATSKIYFRALEIEAGESRSVSDNQTNNMLRYTGAPNEGAINPNYSVSSTEEDVVFESDLTVDSVDALTNMVTFTSSPAKGMQKDDRIKYFDGSQYRYYTIKHPITTRSAIITGDASTLPALVTIQFQRVNQFIEDQDNLTIAHRKQDRQAGYIDTALNRPVYDESVYIQKMNLAGTGTIRSGSYVYKGSLTNPTALAWVLHGNATVTETIESAITSMPGGHPTIGASAILMHVYFGTFSHGDGLNQLGVSTGRTVDNPSNPPFEAPSIEGDATTGVEIVLPANRRTEVKGTEYVTFGAHSFYKQSDDPALTGEELWVVINDTIREASIDYKETFGGPKGKVRIVRDLPPNTRMRFRVMTSFGSALTARSADVTLQAAYNAGNTIVESPARPVEITASDVLNGEAALIARGSILINGGAGQLGGLFGETGDQTFVIGREDNKPKELWSALQMVKSHNSHPASAFITKTAAQVVTGDTPTIITDSFVDLVDDRAYRIKISATARRSDGTTGIATFNIDGGFYKTGGTVFAAGSPISEITGIAGDGMNYALVFGIAGSQVVGVVYGSAGATVQWALTIEFQAVGTT